MYIQTFVYKHVYTYIYGYIYLCTYVYIYIYIGALWEESNGVIYLIKENIPYIIDIYVYTDICI
jgi:hypothetical protein